MSGGGAPVARSEGAEPVSEIGLSDPGAGHVALPRKVLIANRGEIAVRIAATCRSMGIATVTVHSDVDVDAVHVRAGDEAVRLGGDTPASSYLRVDALLEAAARTGADAVHPGYGFLAENAAFARAVVDAGPRWIGPTPEVIATMGDKVAAKHVMADAGVPLVPGAELDGDTDVAAAAEAVGFPLLVKAAAGGGGKGMRVVTDPAELADAVDAARREAAGAFGDDRVFLERYVAQGRHVEVQVLGDNHGAVVHAFERECSVQRRHQKVVEEAPSPGIDGEVRAVLCAAAVDAASALGYVGAGTVEFIADEVRLAARRRGEDVAPADCIAFLEVNTRLQVEHPVTEETVRVREVAGGSRRLDLVREQLLVAAGAPLSFAQDDLVTSGHAIEARWYAEDPAGGYLPQSGPLHVVEPAAGPGVRWDLGVASGDVVSPFYDPMLAKVVASAPTRREAAARLARALDDTVLVGTATNRDLLVAVLRDPAFLAGDTTTSFLDDRFPGGTVAAPRAETVALALVTATLARALDHHATTPVPTVRPGFASAATFAPEVTYAIGEERHRVVWSARRDGTFRTAIEPLAAGEHRDDGDDGAGGDRRERDVVVHDHRVVVDGAVTTCHLDVECAGHRTPVRIVRHGDVHAVATPLGRVTLVEQPRFPDLVEERSAGATLAPMPGAVVTVAVAVGDAVDRGALLCTVEAMKMEHRVTAPLAGEVTEVRVAPGDQVDADDVLIVVTDPSAGHDVVAGEPAT